MTKQTPYAILLFLVLSFTFCSRRLNVEDNNIVASQLLRESALCTKSGTTIEYLGHRYTISNGPLTVAEARTLFCDSTLTATHYALCLHPESMGQLHLLESDKSLIIEYHPFGYVLQQESPLAESLQEEESEIVYKECGIDEQEDDLREICPIYVLWPIAHPFPQGLNYDVLYEVYRPEYLASNDASTRYIEPPHASGHLRSYDNRLGVYKPMKNIKIQYSVDSYTTYYTYTDNNGYFYLTLADIYSPVTVYLRDQFNKFVIRDSTTSNVKEFSLYLTDYKLPRPGNDYIDNCNINLTSNFSRDVYQAAEYYFEGSNDLLNTVPNYDTLGVSIDIHAINSSSLDNYLGCFYYGVNPYIYIWNPYSNYSGASSKVFGTVNHELGHATNYTLGASYMSSTASMIKESFASFMGWYNVSDYYSSYVGTNPALVNSICTQGRQTWTSSSTNLNYTPIFIDLYDGYNQNIELGSSFNNDPISGVPVSFIASCALGPQTYQNLQTLLQAGCGTYYNSSDFNTFIYPYNCFLP